MGQSPSSNTYRKSPEGLPFYQGKADFGNQTPIARTWCVEPIKIALRDDILISVRAPVGPTNLANERCCIGRGLAAIRTGQTISLHFLYNWLKLIEPELNKKGSGSTFQAINKSELEAIAIPLPPLPEQKRIAAILNEQMAAVEKARAAAEAQLAAAKALPAAYLRSVFNSPEAKGWRWVRLGEVITEAQSGFACGERDAKGIIQVRMNNVDTRGNLLLGDFIRVPAEKNTILKYQLTKGDVLFNNTNSAELVGKSALFYGYSEPVVYSNHFTRLRVNKEQMHSGYLVSWLILQWNKKVFENLCNRWIGQSAVKNDKLLNLEIPLPPLPEQKRIAATLNEQMAAAQKLSEHLEEQLDAINKLPTALLRRAFNGEL
jgi:type I restriction enzyme S subunit